MSEKNASKEFELEWIQLRKDLNMEVGETSREKFLRKFKSNPAVPIGNTLSNCNFLIIFQ